MFELLDPVVLDDDELTVYVRELEAVQVRLDAARMRALAEWDRREVWADDGSLSAGARLARETGMPASTARERVRVANRLRSMPLTREAFGEARLGWSKVRMLAAAINERTAKAFERDEAMLVARAVELTADQLAVLLRFWQRTVDEDGANADLDAMHDRQFVRLDESWQGEGFLKGRLDPESRAVVKSAIDVIADELYRAETAAAPEGDAVASLRPPANRDADALVEMARRAMANTDAAASGGAVAPARPLVMLTMDVDALGEFRARLADGTPLAGHDTLRLACDAAIVRVLTRAGSVPVDLGRSSREPSEAQRRAMAALWPTCAFTGCDRPFAWCELHHIIHWIHGGRTDLTNLVPLCARHHHLHHKGVFGITRGADGIIRFARADGQPIGAANPTMPELLASIDQADPAA